MYLNCVPSHFACELRTANCVTFRHISINEIRKSKNSVKAWLCDTHQP